MIRTLEEKDIEIVCSIVNDNWKSVYAGYVNPLLLNEDGCAERIRQLKSDFATHRLSEYVWEENNQVSAYVAAQFQKKGIGKLLLDFAEQRAKEQGYNKIVIWAFKDNHQAVSFYQKSGYCIDKEEYLDEPYFAVGIRLKKEI